MHSFFRNYLAVKIINAVTIQKNAFTTWYHIQNIVFITVFSIVLAITHVNHENIIKINNELIMVLLTNTSFPVTRNLNIYMIAQIKTGSTVSFSADLTASLMIFRVSSLDNSFLISLA